MERRNALPCRENAAANLFSFQIQADSGQRGGPLQFPDGSLRQRNAVCTCVRLPFKLQFAGIQNAFGVRRDRRAFQFVNHGVHAGAETLRSAEEGRIQGKKTVSGVGIPSGEHIPGVNAGKQPGKSENAGHQLHHDCKAVSLVFRKGKHDAAVVNILRIFRRLAFRIQNPSARNSAPLPRRDFDLPAGDLATGGVLSVRDVSTHATVAALSLDGKKLADSRSILLLHLTDISNSDATFFDSDCRFVNSQGKLPLLVRRGSAEVTLKVAPGAPLQVQALSADGDVLGELPVSGNTFPIATDRFPGGVLAWHVTRQE